ncbi:MAG: tetratricopeptide repeat protein [Rhodospirillaceae bacterium]|nr:tetratricopeptide repeat protein [Rhodospirillaceae bacterium]
MRHRLAILACLAATLAAPAYAQTFSVGNGLVDESANALGREQWRKGAELAEKALRSGELAPQNLPAAYNNLCIGLMRTGRLDDAMEACNKAIGLRPRQWSFYNNRANIYFYRNEFDRALAEYYKAMTFSPNDDILLQNIALTLKARRMRGAVNPNRRMS